MRKILISIRPQWVAEILNGDKTTEVRKGTAIYKVINRLIKEQGKAPCLIYCTKEKNKFDTLIPDEKIYIYGCPYDNFHYLKVNGKVVAEFEASAEKIEKAFHPLFPTTLLYYSSGVYETATLTQDELLKRSCLDLKSLDGYLCSRVGSSEGTAIHIHNLKTFDEPKELSEYNKPDVPTYEQSKLLIEMIRRPYTEKDYREDCKKLGYALTKAPQSWCYVEDRG